MAAITEKVEKQWVVVKFGGTSVSYGTTWEQMVQRVRELRDPASGNSYNVLLVLSALTQVQSGNRSASHLWFGLGSEGGVHGK